MFCSECGQTISAGAKFCSNCGTAREALSEKSSARTTGHTVFDWAVFQRDFRPVKNPFTQENEAFEGRYFASWGATLDWLSTQLPSRIWTLMANTGSSDEASTGVLMDVSCKPGFFTGPLVCGYFLCELDAPETPDLEFALGREFSTIERALLVRDGESGLFRPARFRLKGDSTHLAMLNRLHDPLSAWESEPVPVSVIDDAGEQNRSRRMRLGYMWSIELDDDSRDELASEVDPRYFFQANYNEYSFWGEDEQVFSAISEVAGIEGDFSPLMMLNTPFTQGGEPSQIISQCPVCVNFESMGQSDGFDDELPDHWCRNAYEELEGELYGSFDWASKRQYFKIEIPLSEVPDDEEAFRTEVLSKLHAQILNGQIEIQYGYRGEKEMGLGTLQLAFGAKDYSHDKLQVPCTRCARHNPKSAHVCWSCGTAMRAGEKSQLFACIVNDVVDNQIQTMDAQEFADWANIYYFSRPAPGK